MAKQLIHAPRAEIAKTRQQVQAYTRPAYPAKKGSTEFVIGDMLDSMSQLNSELLINDGDPTMHGTSNPMQYNLYSDLIVNPSAVSVSEFQKMYYTQPVISTALKTIWNLVKNEIDEYSNDNATYQTFIREMLSMMDRPFETLLDDFGSALWAGFYVGEHKIETDGRYYYIKDIIPLPAQSMLFRVNSQGKVKEDGIIQYYYNNYWTGYGNFLSFDQFGPNGSRPNPYASLGDLNYPLRIVWVQPIGTVIIPKSKCVHFGFKGLDGLDSPYYRSMLRCCYDAYLQRTEMNRITRNAANFKAAQTPFIVVHPNQTNTTQGQEYFEELGEVLTGLATSGGDNPAVLVKGELNKSIWIDHLDSTANLDQFVNLNKYYDQQMNLGCTLQSDVMGLSDKGSYALGETQADLMGRNVNAIVETVKNALIQQVVRPMLEVNFNETSNWGTFNKAQNVAEDIALNMDKLNILQYQGIKLKPEYILQMLDIDKEGIESINNPTPMDAQKPNTNEGVNTNFRRADGNRK